MNREHVVTGLLALLALFALGGAAATLDAATGGGGGSGGQGDAGTAGPGAASDISPLGIDIELPDRGGPSLPGWVYQLLLVLFVVSLVAGTYLFYRDHGVKRLAGASGLMAVVILVAVYLFRLLSTRSGGGGVPNEVPESQGTPGGAAAGQTAQQAAANDLPTALLVVIGFVLLGAVAVIVRSSGDQTVELSVTEADPDPGSDVEAVAAAAGRAADRIADDADLDNAVFRAWREMTTHLPVENPDASTPAEFADAAVAAGMDPEDVTELTRLFEAVRYGDQPVTRGREEQALDALRRIERTYADVSADAVTDTTNATAASDDHGGGVSDE